MFVNNLIWIGMKQTVKNTVISVVSMALIYSDTSFIEVERINDFTLKYQSI